MFDASFKRGQKVRYNKSGRITANGVYLRDSYNHIFEGKSIGVITNVDNSGYRYRVEWADKAAWLVYSESEFMENPEIQLA